MLLHLLGKGYLTFCLIENHWIHGSIGQAEPLQHHTLLSFVVCSFLVMIPFHSFLSGLISLLGVMKQSKIEYESPLNHNGVILILVLTASISRLMSRQIPYGAELLSGFSRTTDWFGLMEGFLTPARHWWEPHVPVRHWRRYSFSILVSHEGG